MSQSQAQSVLETAVQNQPKKRGCRRGCQGCLIAVVVLAVPLVWFNIPTALRVSKETTYVLGPMTSDGKRIDYFRAMEERFYPPQMKTDENGYRLIVRAFGDMVQRETGCCSPESIRLQVYEKLGLDPNEQPTLKVEGSICCPATRLTPDEFPLLKDYVEANTAGIDLLGEAVRKPAFRIPYVRENENTPVTDSILQLGEAQMMKGWGSSALARALYRIEIGNIDGAIYDIVTLHHLARHTVKHGTLIFAQVGIAIKGMALSVGIGSNPECPPTKEQIERLMREMDALPPRWTLEEALESERYFGLATMQDQYWGNFSGGDISMFPMMGLTMDINVALTRLNKVYDALLIPGATIDGKTLEELLDPSRQSWNPLPFFSKRNRTERIMDSMIALFIPAMQATREAWRRTECCENLQRLTFALLLYEKEHGSLPDGDWREALLAERAGDIHERAGGIQERAGDISPPVMHQVSPVGLRPPLLVFRCPSHPGLVEDDTTYAMVSGVPNAVSSPNRILLVEVVQPQKLGETRLGEGDGRIPFEQATFETGLGSGHPGGINVGLRSGAVRFISQTVNAEVWQSLLDGTADALP